MHSLAVRVFALAPGVCLLLAGVSPRLARAQGAPPPTSASLVPAIVTQGKIDPRLDVNFSAYAVPSTVYVGQQVTYQIGVFLSGDVAQRLRRNPEFVPPDVRSMLAYDLPSPSLPLRRDAEGRSFNVHVFQRALFPLTAGTHTLAPARLTYALPLSNTFFSREETHSARTGALTITAKEPPAAGRPQGFAGAVGRIALSARVDTPTSRVGDPVTVVVSVRGVGNVSLFPRPQLSVPWGDAINGAERVAIDSGLPLIQGRKEFEWVVTPRKEGTLEVPPLRYPYWNPYTEQYEVAITNALPLHVAGGGLAARLAAPADSSPRLSVRTHFRGALPLPLAQSPILWAILGIVPIPALALGMLQRPRSTSVERPDIPLQRLASAGVVRAADLRRAFTSAIVNRTGVGGVVMAEGRSLVRSLRRVGVSAETAQRAQLVLADIERATYGGGALDVPGELARRAADTYTAIDAEAIPPRAARVWIPPAARVALVSLALGGGTVLSVRADEAQDQAQFARGVAAYERGDIAESMEAFRAVVTNVPRAADAWANLGTAAWYANDSASAAIGWQRALRLEPLAQDVRGRLESTPGFRPGLLGDVPPIPIDALAALGVVAWFAGWGQMAWAISRRRGALRGASLATVGCAAVVGVLTIALSETLSGRHQVIVLASDRLRSVPALGAEASSEVLAGEGASEATAQGVWSRLRFADGRSGWIESRHLGSLDLTRLP